MRIYFMGICGTAMGNAALLLKNSEHEVMGCDHAVYPPMSTMLKEGGIDILEGYDPIRLQALKPDLVVIGNANSRGNPEVEYLLNSKNIPYTSLPQLLSDFVLKDRQNIVVSGTHGKTTTTAMTAFLLNKSGKQPGWLVGGAPRDLDCGSTVGNKKDAFVIEGDEYDSAFFDKRSKFIHYRPQILIINNIEFDHSDIFRDLQDVLRSFNHLLRIIPSKGFAIVNGDDLNIESLLPVPWTQVIKVGTGRSNDLRIEDFKEGPDGSEFKLRWKGALWGKIKWKLHGEYNARNAACAALAAGLSIKPEDPFCPIELQHLREFKGVKRRQEKLLETTDLTVIEDFAHHPSAIKQSLQSFRNRYPKHEIIACFEPRSNTAVTNVFEKEFTNALAQADIAMLGEIFRKERIPVEKRLNEENMMSELEKRGVQGIACGTNLALLEKLKEQITPDKKQLICLFSNGAFSGIMKELVKLKQN